MMVVQGIFSALDFDASSQISSPRSITNTPTTIQMNKRVKPHQTNKMAISMNSEHLFSFAEQLNSPLIKVLFLFIKHHILSPTK